MVSVSSGLPAWEVYLGGAPQSVMAHNTVSLGGALVTIFGPQSFPEQILEGSYTVFLQPSTAGPPTSTVIGQTGQIPQTAESLRFYGRGAFNVTFGGQPIPLVTLGTDTNYTILGGDISAFVNQTGELLFQGGGFLDAIQFSSQPIPEPGVLALLAFGALVAGRHWLRRRG
jgi:hypothetical protein